jgi:N-acetylneuraminate synthase
MTTYIIAEIGINHNGSLKTAKKLIDVAAVAGCDAVKLQKRNPDICVPEAQKNKPKSTPWGDMTYLEYKKMMEFGEAEFNEIDKYCKERGIAWSASPWDMDSLDFLCRYELPWIKIPSALLTDKKLIAEASRQFDKVIISTGMSTAGEITAAYKIWKQNRRLHSELVIMQCNSAYPSRIEDLNLNCIRSFAAAFPGADIGYSGHEYGLTTTMASIYLGATYLERHITLDRTMWGTDQTASVEPHGLIKLVKGVRELEMALGDGCKTVTEAELPARKKLRGV